MLNVQVQHITSASCIRVPHHRYQTYTLLSLVSSPNAPRTDTALPETLPPGRNHCCRSHDNDMKRREGAVIAESSWVCGCFVHCGRKDGKHAGKNLSTPEPAAHGNFTLALLLFLSPWWGYGSASVHTTMHVLLFLFRRFQNLEEYGQQ